jgi:flagellin
MAIALSAQMMTNLVGLTSINNDMATTQSRLASGKKIDSVLDNAAVYFRAKSMEDKASAYDAVNAGISAGLKNVELANKGLSTMYDNLNGLLTQLKDAQSKSITAGAAPATAGGRAYGGATSSLVAARVPPATGTGPSVASPTDLADSSLFQVGDRISISYRQTDGTTRTRFFEAADTPAAGAPALGTQTGAAAASAITFNTAADLQNAIKSAFGQTDIQLNVSATGTLSLTTPTTEIGTSISVGQVTDASTAGAGNARLDFTRIFGSATDTAIQSGTGAAAVTAPGGSAIVAGGQLVTYTATGNATTAANTETRRQAADTYKTTLLQLNNITRDAYMPGMVNLLTASSGTTSNVMAIDLNEDVGDVVQNVSIGGPVDPANLGFTGFNSTTGADNQTTTNFNDTPTMTAAVARVTAAMSTIRIRQNALAANTTMLSTRLDFNKAFQGMLSGSANELTAADTAQEAANMAAAQNRQSFATNNLSVTKQAESSLIQLLR